MPCGKKWDSYERQLAAKAYICATQNCVQGCDMRSKTFQESVFKYFKQLEPKDVDPHKFSNRGAANLWGCLRDLIFPDVQKFSGALMVVENSVPTGNLNEADYHCIAIAIHLKKIRGLDYSYSRFGSNGFEPAAEWDNYLAFLELRLHPKFQNNNYYDVVSGNGNGNVHAQVVDINNVIINSNEDNNGDEHDLVTPVSKTSKYSDESSRKSDDMFGKIKTKQ